MVQRYITSTAIAILVTLGLFYLMQSLISRVEGELGEEGYGRVIDFVRLRKDSELELRKRSLPDRAPPEQPPPPPDLDMSRQNRPDAGALAIAAPGFDVGLDMNIDLGGAPSDADILPLVRVEPQYPIRASERGIEGWVIVEFTISSTGTVKDPIVVDNHPSSIFNRAALRAIRKWKYKPKIENGKPVERAGVKVRLTFELEA